MRHAVAGREDISCCSLGNDSDVPVAHRAHQTAHRAEARGASLEFGTPYAPAAGPPSPRLLVFKAL